MNTKHEWFRNAGAGMFIHWGIYSVIGRGEWAMCQERIPLAGYDRNIAGFTAEKYNPDEWAQLAKSAGMRYMVLTTKHHDGFCLFNTSTTTRNAAVQGPKRDLVKEYADACRRNGMKVGFYYSWPDWSVQAYNDGPEKDSKAWEDYITLIHQQTRELCSNYGKIDVFWYDIAPNLNGATPMTAELLRSSELNSMVRQLQPEIVINDRALEPGDFHTSEQRISPPPDPERLWETCLTMNKHWGYFPADDMYKSPKEIVHTMTAIASSGGNMLLNVGPAPDGTIGDAERQRLQAFGRWLGVHREAVAGMSRCKVGGGTYGCTAQKGGNVYLFVHWWHGPEITIADCQDNFSSGEILGIGKPVKILRDGAHIRLIDLPKTAPDPLCTVIDLKLA